MLRWCALVFLTIAGVMAGAIAQNVKAQNVKAQDNGLPDIVFEGTARTATDTRPVRFHFFCSSNGGPNVTGVLAVELEIPQYGQLSKVFDFEPFEGPDANVGQLTLLHATGVRSKASDRFAAAGSIVPSGASEAFVLGVNASRREPGPLHKLAIVLRPLTEGPAQLAWQQGNARSRGPPMTASLALDTARSEQLQTGLGPCLGAR
jgi:hypothetical protein